MSAVQMERGTVPAFELRHRLHLALEVAGLRPEDMADEIGRSATTIRNYLAGRTRPDRAVITAWALRCEISRAWLECGHPSGGGPRSPLHIPRPGVTRPELAIGA